ncbi:hypothetical protein ABB02_00709 [Clostridiaceae bacterium JG1575]|nr:hypothetical protein ABB02_00709 [Clostridiaceae bacterium JG1575]
MRNIRTYLEDNRWEATLFIGLLSLFFLDLIWGDFPVSTGYNLLLFLFLLWFSLRRLKARLGLLFFSASVFFFLAARPLMDVLTNFRMHVPFNYHFPAAHRANLMISCSMLALIMGQMLYEWYFGEGKTAHGAPWPKEGVRRWMAPAAWGLFGLSLLALWTTSLERVAFRRSHSYTALYAAFRSQLPFVILGLSALCVGFFLVVLCTSKSRKAFYWALGLYTASTGIVLFAGVRANFIKSLMVALFLWVGRDVLKRKLSWKDQGRLLLAFLVVASLLVGILTVVGNSRNELKRRGQFSLPVQFFYDQSISYIALTRGQEMKAAPLSASPKHYTFGPFIDTLTRKKALGAYSLDYVKQGNSFAADIAYYLYGENALKGVGLGSSYIIETYLDFGYVGLGCYSLLLGGLLASLSAIRWRNYFLDAVKLRILLEIFYIPRAPATQMILNLAMPQFLLPIGGLWLFGMLLHRLRPQGPKRLKGLCAKEGL